MYKKNLTRLFVLLLVALSAFLFISHKQAKSYTDQDCTNGGKCGQKPQSDFILLEPISRHLLPASEE